MMSLNCQLARTLLSAALIAALAACMGGRGPSDANNPNNTPPPNQWDQALAARVVNYGAALRTAALKLIGDLPTADEMAQMQSAGDPLAVYTTLVDKYMADPRFATQVVNFWRDTFRMGGAANLDSAPFFAAQLTIENRSYMELFTATTNTCPTFNAQAGTFTPGNCTQTAPATVGVLTDPNVLQHYASNLAFRRVRFVQETFACTHFPAEVTSPKDVGGAAPYTGAHAFASIAGTANGGRVNFLDASAVVCANCHSTMNHIAPLLGNFNDQGMYQATIQVKLPTQGNPVARATDWLPAGEAMYWRFGTAPITNLTELGQRMAADPAVAACGVARTWNWMMGKGDIVTTLALVPTNVIQSHIDAFKADGYKMKGVIRAVLLDENFRKF
jgi:Protein of unknown function (DUF1588)